MVSEQQEKLIQKKYRELQLLEEQLSYLSKQHEFINEQIAELDAILAGVEELKEAKAGSQMKAQFAQGIYVDATLSSREKVLMSVGANVFLPKTLKDAQQILEHQKGELLEVLNRMEKGTHEVSSRFSSLQQELLSLSKSLQE